MNFTREQIEQAIRRIDNNPDLINGRESLKYDLVHDGKRYPPILVLSEANKLDGGEELLLSDFGNSTKKPFKILKQNGFNIVEKPENNVTKFNPETNNAWIEKTIVKNRSDRQTGPYQLGKRLWSPRKDGRGADIYKNMRKVEPGDLVIHFIDNKKICGVSLVREGYKEGQGVQGSKWEGEAYIIELKGYRDIENINRDDILKRSNKVLLDQIRESNDVFYTRNLNLRQGAYLTECPIELLRLINNEYVQQTDNNLPYLNNSTFESADLFSPQTANITKQFKDDLKHSNLKFNSDIVARLIISLATKPFLILTGLSGSGKTKIAQAFSKWISVDNEQTCIVPVGADWTNREPLLGYPNALKDKGYEKPDSGILDLIIKASNNRNKPFFLILDEMNLSHVERYFADFLSAMESGDEIKLHSGKKDWDGVPPTIEIPDNLFVIGTVNIDETTYMFSPKVLDRANVIEFRITSDELENFLQEPQDVNVDSIKGMGASLATEFIEIANTPTDSSIIKEELNTELINFFNELKKVGAEFGYRSAHEIQRFASIASTKVEDWSTQEITDIVIVQKLLPKLHGSRRKLEPVLRVLASLCIKDDASLDNILDNPYEFDFNNSANVKYPISLEKIVRMHNRLLENGFTSFAEA